MNIKKTHQAFVSNWIILAVCICAFLAFRLHSNWVNIEFFASTLIQVGIALFLLQFNNIFVIIHRRTLLPALFYIILVGSSPIFNLEWKANLAALLIVLNYVFLFQTYQKPDSQLNAFNISLILALGSFLQPQLLLFFLLFWIGFYWFYSFNLRVFLASLTGVVVVFLFIFAWCIYQDDWKIGWKEFLTFLPKSEDGFLVREINITNYKWINLGIILLTYIFAGFNLFVASISEKIRTVSFLKFLYISSFFIFAMSFVQSKYQSFWELTVYISIALILAHYFTLTNKTYVKVIMLLFLLALLTIRLIQHFSS